jgi:hypothetical protein
MGEKTKLGFLPISKVPATVGAKAWNDYRKLVDQATAARQAVTVAKEHVRLALAKKLNLNADEIDFWSNDEKLTVIRRDKERKQRASTLPELTIQ